MKQEISRFTLEKERSVLVIVDVQEKLIRAMPERTCRRVLNSIGLLQAGTDLLGVPAVVTEQYPKGLGHTAPELSAAHSGEILEKVSFGCCGEPAFVERLAKLDRPQVILAGMETHVCVYQTVLALLEKGYRVHLVRDAVISRHKRDGRTALELAAQAGATVTTTETVLFQLLQTAAAPQFKAISNLVKEFGNRP